MSDASAALLLRPKLSLDVSIMESKNPQKEFSADVELSPAGLLDLSAFPAVHEQTHNLSNKSRAHRLASLLQSRSMKERVKNETVPKSKEEYVRILFMAVRQDSVPYLKGILNPAKTIIVPKSNRKKTETNALQGKFLFVDRYIR